MKTLSILGCGWLGRAVAAKFVDKGWHVNGSVRSQDKLFELEFLGINPFKISLDQPLANENQHEFFNADVLLVAVPPKNKTGESDCYLHQISSLAAYLSSCCVPNVIFISSTSVYPELSREVFEEDADSQSILFMAEQYLLKRSEFTTTVLRFGGLIGPDRHPGYFLAGKTNLAGGNSPINMIHKQDCVNVIYSLVLNEAFGNIFNACADLHPTKKDFYIKACRAVGMPSPVFDEQPSPFKLVNSDKLKNQLSFQFSFPDLLSIF